MRFALCGGLDCPDWLLLEIATLSKVSAVRIRLLAQHVVAQELAGERVDDAKASKLVSDTKLDDSAARAVLAALHFVISGAAKHDVEEGALIDELQQLGLPKEHADAICRPYQQRRAAIQAHAQRVGLRCARLQSSGYRVEHVLASSEQSVANTPIVTMRLDLTTGERLAFAVDADGFDVLYAELQRAHEALAAVSGSMFAEGGGAAPQPGLSGGEMGS
mmetsp:Transcript_20127/g.51867  ORF Transcript_20127/g.51867 Transcript_20127/m.51867 type:complete len:219 (+) Transcript_20127:29-685(+)